MAKRLRSNDYLEAHRIHIKEQKKKVKKEEKKKDKLIIMLKQNIEKMLNKN